MVLEVSPVKPVVRLVGPDSVAPPTSVLNQAPLVPETDSRRATMPPPLRTKRSRFFRSSGGMLLPSVALRMRTSVLSNSSREGRRDAPVAVAPRSFRSLVQSCRNLARSGSAIGLAFSSVRMKTRSGFSLWARRGNTATSKVTANTDLNFIAFGNRDS